MKCQDCWKQGQELDRWALGNRSWTMEHLTTGRLASQGCCSQWTQISFARTPVIAGTQLHYRMKNQGQRWRNSACQIPKQKDTNNMAKFWKYKFHLKILENSASRRFGPFLIVQTIVCCFVEKKWRFVQRNQSQPSTWDFFVHIFVHYNHISWKVV